MGRSVINVEDGQNWFKKYCHLRVWALTVSVKCSQKRRENNGFLFRPHLRRMARGEAYASTHNRNKKSGK